MDDLTYIKEKLDILCDAVLGDPTDQNNPGMLLRIDRLEQSRKNMRNGIILLSGGLMTVITTIILRYI